MPDAIQRLHEQGKVLETLKELLGEIREAEAALSGKAAAALGPSLAIRQRLDSLPSEYLPRERQALLARVQALDDRIDEALRMQVRGIFARQRTHTADALRKDYLEVGLKNPDLLKRLTDAMVAATEALNQEEAGAANSQVQARQRWQAVYDACDGKQPALAAARKKAKGYLPPWWQKYWPLLAGGAILVVALVFAATYFVQPRSEPVIDWLEPASVNEGSGAVMLTLAGSNFDPDAVVQWVGTDNKTIIITPTPGSTDQVTVTVGANLLQQAGNVRITVRNRAANQVSNEKLFVIQALTPTPTHTPVTPTDTPVTPTDTPKPTNTPTNTPTPVIGDLSCVLKLTVSENGEAQLPIEKVTVGEPKIGLVSWSFTVLPVEPKDCGSNGQSDVEEITKRDYRLTPADQAGWLVERKSPTLRLKKAGPLKVELVHEWRIKALTENQEAGSLNFGLEYQISAEEWKPVQGSDGKPLQITLKWDQIKVATATPTATHTPTPIHTPTPTRTPTPSKLNGTILLTDPGDGQTLTADQNWKFRWEWNGPALQGKQVFRVQFIKNGTETLECPLTTKTQCDFSLPTGEYEWKVWIEDGAGKKISDESSVGKFVVRDRKSKSS
jgi:hypothetical protein